jgi:hypothetical protein
MTPDTRDLVLAPQREIPLFSQTHVLPYVADHDLSYMQLSCDKLLYVAGPPPFLLQVWNAICPIMECDVKQGEA